MKIILHYLHVKLVCCLNLVSQYQTYLFALTATKTRIWQFDWLAKNRYTIKLSCLFPSRKQFHKVEKELKSEISSRRKFTNKNSRLEFSKNSASDLSRGYTSDFCCDFRSDFLLLNDVKE